MGFSSFFFCVCGPLFHLIRRCWSFGCCHTLAPWEAGSELSVTAPRHAVGEALRTHRRRDERGAPDPQPTPREAVGQGGLRQARSWELGLHTATPGWRPVPGSRLALPREGWQPGAFWAGGGSQGTGSRREGQRIAREHVLIRHAGALTAHESERFLTGIVPEN